MKKVIIFLSLVVFFAFGIYVSIYKAKKITDVALLSPLNAEGVSRDPAAIKRTYDFSGLDGTALEFAAKQRLLQGIRVVQGGSDAGIELGHYVIKSNEGQKTFACQKYDKIHMTFVGEGSAVSGELPQMQVEGHCEISSDVNSISALMIPYAKILSEPVSEGEFSFRDGSPISVQFSNVSEQWPRVWRLTGVRLYDVDQNRDFLDISDTDLKKMMTKPITLSWK